MGNIMILVMIWLFMFNSLLRKGETDFRILSIDGSYGVPHLWAMWGWPYLYDTQ